MNQAERETYILAICAACGKRYPSENMQEKVSAMVDAVYGCGLADGMKQAWADARATVGVPV